jgi:hypothetical protein
LSISLAVSAASPVLGQARRAPAPANNAAGLDSLRDDRLLSELAGRNLTTLLDRAFEINNVPIERRNAVLARVAFTQLRTAGQTMGAAALDELVRQAVSGVSVVLPSLDDPSALMEDVSALLVYGVQRDLDIIEFWGENPRTQSKLRPVTEAVVKMTARARELAKTRADALAEQIRNPNDRAAIERWTQMNNLAETAEYTGNIVRYYQALSLDRADPNRAAIARDAIDYLEQFDVEENPDRNFVRILIGKLNATIGTDASLARAREILDQVIAEPADPPNLAQQFEARFARTRVEIEARQLEPAREQNRKLDEWTRQALPNDTGVKVADMMLEYRIHNLAAELATDPTAREAANKQAVDTLLALVELQPSLRPIVFDQLASKLTDNTDLKTLDVLLLESLVDRGRIEALKGEAEQVDEKALSRAIEAAREMLRRKGSAGITPRRLETAAFLLPFMLERLNQPADAASAYLDYAEQFPQNAEQANVALTNAEVRIAQLRRTDPANDRIGPLEDRLLPIATNEPFNRSELLFRYGYRLQQQQKIDEAIAIYRKLPTNDPNFQTSRYLLMVLLNAQLSRMDASDARRAAQTQEILQLADSVTTNTQQQLSAAQTDRERAVFRSRLVGTKVLAAQLANDAGKQPERALTMLEGIEDEARGLPDAATLIGEALKIRVDALRSLNRLNEAAAQLKQLTETGGEAGVASVVELLKALDSDYDAALARNDKAAMRQIAQSRAMLTPELVRWASENSKPEYRKFVYRYSVLDADTQRLAADLSEDPAEQRTLRERALARYKELESEANFRLFLEGVPELSRAATRYDPAVVLGIGRLEYDLGNYQAALGRFQRLLEDRTIGPPVVKQTRQSVEVEVDNELYWEIVVKFIRSNLAVDDSTKDAMTRFLKVQLVTWRERAGGTRWKDEIAKLQKELAPDWQLPALPAS